jgi:tight adherence protein B
MPYTAQQILTYLAMAATFGLVLALWVIFMILWISRRSKHQSQFQERLRLAEPDITPGTGRVLRLWRNGKDATTVVHGYVKSGGIMAWMENLRTEAGWETSVPSALLSLVGVMALVSLITWMITNTLVVTMAAPIAVLVVFWIYLQQRISRRGSNLERQLIDSMDLAARSLRAGHPLIGAFRLISEEIPAPIGEVFARVCQQQDLGVDLNEALRAVAADSNSDDLKLFVTSVVIQLRSGGNLADMMERLADVIRERNRLMRRVKVLTAQTQFSKRVLLSLPFLVFFLLNWMNPDYMRPLYSTSSGQIIMGASGVGLLLGWMTMNWLAKLTF